MTVQMKAAVYTQYGAPEVLQIQEVEKPTPKDNEILVKIHATAVTSGDSRLRRADPFPVRFMLGLFGPGKKILGDGFSGEVEAVGGAVTKFKAGDQVFGTLGMRFGAYAEYKCVPETGVVAIQPENSTHEAAATVHFGAATALHFLKKAKVLPGQKVLIYGASGAVGSAAVQLAKYFGAEVTGVCSTRNVEMVKSIGADRVIDYTQTSFTQSGPVYDVVFETVGKAPLSECLKVLKNDGVMIQGSAMLIETLRGLWAGLTGSRKVLSGVAIEKNDDLLFLKKLMEEGRLKPVIDKTYPLAEIAEAHRYVDGGHKSGNVAVRVV